MKRIYTSIAIFCAALMPLCALAGNTATRLSNLPQHLALGVRMTYTDLTNGYMSNAPWEYDYTYLTKGWESWNTTPYGSGSIVRLYAQQGNIPVFNFYVFPGENNYACSGYASTCLQSTTIMASYYTNFTLALQQAANSSPGANKIIFDIEPDLWGFIQQQGNADPTQVTVSVASSGNTDLTGLPNTAAGFAQAFIKLRDIYAPNAMIAFHASWWGSSNTHNWSPFTGGNPTNAGTDIASFYNKLSAPFDLMFWDTDDRDADFNVKVCSATVANSWWTATSYSDYETLLGTVYGLTGVHNVLWQTPVGNTLYKTEDDTTYHYQDNHVQFFLASGSTFPASLSNKNLYDIASSGVIAILFGMGQQAPYSQCDTTKSDTDHLDYDGDGIYNPAPINGNNLVATVSDDDGGYLRSATTTYYNGTLVPWRPSCACGLPLRLPLK